MQRPALATPAISTRASTEGATCELIVPCEDGGSRLDGFLARSASRADCPNVLRGLSRARLQRLIGAGAVRLHGNTPVMHAAARLRAGDVVRVYVPAPRPASLDAVAMPLDVLFEDEHLLAINKAPGRVVHPGAGVVGPTLVHGLLAHCTNLSGIGGERRPGIVHRLDKDTSGIIVVAKHDRAHVALARQFAARQVIKIYRAVVWGRLEAPAATLNTLLSRHPAHRQRFTSRADLVRRRGGASRQAITRYVCEAQAAAMAAISVRPHTGRTHQIRVHMADAGHPIVGDAVYGKSRSARPPGAAEALIVAVRALQQHALHAWELHLQHPCDGRPLALRAPMPLPLCRLWDAVRGLAG